MRLAYSRVTAQGQISVPAEVRKALGIGPGALLEWDAQDEQVVVRRAGRYSSEDIHRELFAKPPKRRSPKELKNGVRKYIRGKHARG
jgi:AbrB family looped-hinge helix DNA binding protein